MKATNIYGIYLEYNNKLDISETKQNSKIRKKKSSKHARNVHETFSASPRISDADFDQCKHISKGLYKPSKW